MINNNEFHDKYIKLKDNSKNKIIRPSSFTRITLGTFFSSSSCFIYSLIFAKLKKLDHVFVRKYLKGSFLLSLGFFGLNEIVYSTSKYFGIYSNFFINYSITSYIMSKFFYRHLIRNHYMQWDKAIKYSHKCFLIFCVFISALELMVYLYREIHLFDGDDFFDYFEKKLKNKNDHITFKDIENNFMCSFHILNNPEKRKLLDKYIYENSRDGKTKNDKYQTVNLYKFYRDNGKYI